MSDEIKTISIEEHQQALKNTREATERKIAKQYEGFINPADEDYSMSMKELGDFRTAKKLSHIEQTHFNDFKVKDDYKKDVFKLADITTEDDDKTIKTKLTEFSSLDKNKVYFQTEDTSAQTEQQTNPTSAVSPSSGGTFWDRFKKK